MNKDINKALSIWHKVFEDEDKQYSEFESSDVEYFLACMLYNNFKFENALDTMKTIDLSYDFLLSVEDNFDEVNELVENLSLEEEEKKLMFLMTFLADAKSKYTEDELYLINRMEYHLDGVKQRYEGLIKKTNPNFSLPKVKSRNPLAGL